MATDDMYYDLRESFLESTVRLPSHVKGKVLECIRKLQSTPRASGLNLEALQGKAIGLASARIDDKYRLILHRGPDVVTLFFAGVHDEAYRFAGRVPKGGYATGPGEMPTPVPTVPAPVEAQGQRPARPTGLSKYVPLARHLLNIDSKVGEIVLSFGEFEEIIGRELPQSARKHQPWCSNDTEHVQAKAWLSVGWRSCRPDLSHESVKFKREQRIV